MPPLSHPVMARFLCASQVPLHFSSLYKMLIASVWPSHVYLFPKMFLSSFTLLHAKGWYFKTLWIYKTLKILLCRKMDLSDVNSHLIQWWGPTWWTLLSYHGTRSIVSPCIPPPISLIHIGIFTHLWEFWWTWEQNSQVLDQDSKHKVKLHEIIESLCH